MNPMNIDGYPSSKGSVNRHIIHGMHANQYFSPSVIRETLKSMKELKFDDNTDILFQANALLNKKNKASKLIAEVFYQYGLRLAEILYIFDHPSDEQKTRDGYTEVEWDYLKHIKKIYLAGGLLTENFTPIFMQAISDFFKTHTYHKEIIVLDQKPHLALIGIQSKSDVDALVFDFGQTHVKCGRYEAGKLLLFDQVHVNIAYDEDHHKHGANCHQFIYDIILKQLHKYPRINQVHMAISNYVKAGKIDPAPWPYGVLGYFESQYQSYLETVLSEALNKDIKVKLYHDTTAMGYVIEDKKDAMLISLGTAFGVSYF